MKTLDRHLPSLSEPKNQIDYVLIRQATLHPVREPYQFNAHSFVFRAQNRKLVIYSKTDKNRNGFRSKDTVNIAVKWTPAAKQFVLLHGYHLVGRWKLNNSPQP